jgi:phosphoribosylamine--glycine ligase
MKRSILFVSLDYGIIPIAWKIKIKEGIDTYVWCPYRLKPLEDVVNYVDTINEGLKYRPSCIVFDGSGKGDLADKLKKDGYKVIGAGVMNDRLEYDRDFGYKIMQMAGIKTGEIYKFSNIKQVKSFIRDNRDKLYVLKPMFNAPNYLTFIPRDITELDIFIDWVSTTEYANKRWILQEKIDGYEVSSEIEFSNGRPLYPIVYTFETKKRDVNDLGPTVGSSTSVIFRSDKSEPYIVQKFFKKIYLLMEKLRYTGPLDINCIVNNTGVYGLEFTPRLGWNFMYAFIELLDIPIGEYFIKLAEGSLDKVPLKDGYGYAINVVLPEYPSDDYDVFKKYTGMPIFYRSEDRDHIWPIGCRLGDKGLEVYTDDGLILCVSSYDKDMFKAEEKAINILDNILLPTMSARVGDGVKHAKKRIDGLKELRWWF